METLNNGKILILDDDTFLVKIYEEKFARAQCVIKSANTVEEALRILRGGFVPNILIVDVELDGRDGFSFLEEIREQHLAEGAYSIVLTNHTEEIDKKRAVDLGVNAYVVKAVMIPDEVVTMALSAIQGVDK